MAILWFTPVLATACRCPSEAVFVNGVLGLYDSPPKFVKSTRTSQQVDCQSNIQKLQGCDTCGCTDNDSVVNILTAMKAVAA